MFCIVNEPLRIITRYFLHISWWVGVHKFPPICNMLWTKTSVVHAAGQYYSAMLAGAVPRLQLVWHMMGHPSLESWAAAHLDLAKLLRRSILAAMSGIWRRHAKRLQEWALFSIADVRRPYHEREDICRRFLGTRPCCLKSSSWRRLWYRLDALSNQQARLEALLALQPVFLHAGWRLKLTIAEVERCHARNKARGHTRKPFDVLAAEFLNDECLQRKTANDQLAKEQEAFDSIHAEQSLAVLERSALRMRWQRLPVSLHLSDAIINSIINAIMSALSITVTTMTVTTVVPALCSKNVVL